MLVGDQPVKLLTAEYLKRRKGPRWPANWFPDQIRQEAERRVQRLLDLCHEEWRVNGAVQRGRLKVDGALFLRFLGQKEV